MNSYNITHAEVVDVFFRNPGVRGLLLEMLDNFKVLWNKLTPLGRVFVAPVYAIVSLCVLIATPFSFVAGYLLAPPIGWLISVLLKLKPLFVR